MAIIIGTPVSDVRVGTPFDDEISGLAGDDSLVGGGGLDRLIGGAGNDTLDGTRAAADTDVTDTDSADYRNEGGTLGVFVNVSAATVTAPNGYGFDGIQLQGGRALDTFGDTDTLIDIEQAIGTAQSDVLIGGNPANGDSGELFVGLGGNDYIDGGAAPNPTTNTDINRVRYNFDDAAGGSRGVVVNLSSQDYTSQGIAKDVDAGTVVVAGHALDGFGDTDTLVHINGVRGTKYADELVAAASGTSFQALGGNDLLLGGAGFDTADYRRDFADGGGTFGVVVNLTIGALTNIQVTGAFYATVAAGTAKDGLGGTDTLVSIDEARGTDFNDYLVAAAGGSRLRGEGGNDTIVSGLLGDRLEGGGGLDTLSYANSAAAVTVNLTATNQATGQQTASGGDAQGDLIFGFEAVIGSAAADTLTGNAGNNVIMGGGGADILAGGDGFDTVSYASSAQAVTVNLGTQTASGGDAAGDTLSGFEAVTGSRLNDTLIGGAGENTFFGRAGNDQINGTDAAGDASDVTDKAVFEDQEVTAGVFVNLSSVSQTRGTVTVAATTARETYGASVHTDTLTDIEGLVGTRFNDILIGSSTANLTYESFAGGAGNDSIDGGAGTNEIRYDEEAGSRGVVVNLGAAARSLAEFPVETPLPGQSAPPATIAANSAYDTFGATDTLANINTVCGTAFTDVLLGGAGNERFRGLGGDDYIDGGAGVNEINYQREAQAGGTAGVRVNLTAEFNADLGLEGGTAVDGFGFADSLRNIQNVTATDQADAIVGDGAANLLRGLGGSDVLIGGAGADTLNGDDATGGFGDDWLDGGAGVDVVQGGDGNDTVVVRGDEAVTDTLNGGLGAADAVLVEGAGDVTLASFNAFTQGFEAWLGNGAGLLGTAADNMFNLINLTLVADLAFVDGGAGNDTIIGTADDDTFRIRGAEAVGDTLNGGGGFDRILVAPGSGNVTLTKFDAVTQSIEAWDGNGAGLVGTGNADSLNLNGLVSITGLAFIDGGAGNDVITGSAFGEVIKGGAGADALAGGGGVDTVSYQGSALAVTVNLGTSLTGQQTATGGDAAGDIISGFENAIGGNGNDSLVGNLLNNVLDGGAGNDTVLGGDGDDTIIVRAAEAAGDNLQGGLGLDRIQVAGVGDVTLTNLNAAGLGFEAWEGNGAGLLGTAGNNLFDLSGFGSNVTGLAFIDAGAGSDTVIGSAGADTVIIRGAEAVGDLLQGGLGFDTLKVAGAGDVTLTSLNATAQGFEVWEGNGAGLLGTAGNTLFDLSGFGNNVTGLAFIDAGAGSDTVIGSAGDDTIIIRDDARGDLFAGGLGTDTLKVAGTGDVVLAFFGPANGIEVWEGNGHAIRGSAGVDVLDLSGLATVHNLAFVDGGAGADTITGTAVNDDLRGGSGNDLLAGGLGGDTLNGGGGVDTLVGGDGNDTYYVDTASDIVTEGATAGSGLDTVISTAGSYTLTANVENLDLVGAALSGTGNALGNAIHGNALGNLLAGGAGNDTLDGGAGVDTVQGGADDDTLVIRGSEALQDVMDGGGGIDTLHVDGVTGVTLAGFNAAASSIEVWDGNNQGVIGTLAADVFDFSGLTSVGGLAFIDGGAGGDTITGTNFGTELRGGGGNDVLNGGSGGDLLVGGAGQDSLTGGGGDDRFQLARGPASEADAILDFTNVGQADKLVVKAAEFGGGLVAGALPATYLALGAATETGHGQFLYDAGTGQLSWDTDGTGAGAAVLVATLTGSPVLQNTDFLIV